MHNGASPGTTHSKLRGRIGRGDGFVALRLDGIIDEHNTLDQWLAAVGEGQTLLVDLGGVKRLNSVGVRDWVNWLRALRAKWKSIVLFDCPPPVMNEVNFVRNFAEGAVITTFQAPLFCSVCKKEEVRTLDALQLRESRAGLPAFRCERSDCGLALDDDPESYLSFIEELPKEPDAQRLATLTTMARELLKNEGAQPVPLDASGNASAARANALSQLGLASQPPQSRVAGQRPTTAPPSPNTASPSGSAALSSGSAGATTGNATTPSAEPKKAGGDWLFVGAIAAMVAVLGVLIYLLVTLE